MLTRVAAFPIGMDPESFAAALKQPDVCSNITQLRNRFGGRKVCWQHCLVHAYEQAAVYASTRHSCSVGHHNVSAVFSMSVTAQSFLPHEHVTNTLQSRLKLTANASCTAGCATLDCTRPSMRTCPCRSCWAWTGWT